MDQQYIKVANLLYKEMKKNIDIIEYWFKKENKELDEQKLFKYEKCDFTPELESESDIYVFVNKIVNNILYGRNFQIKNSDYLESNFVSLVNIIIDEYRDFFLSGDIDGYN